MSDSNSLNLDTLGSSEGSVLYNEFPPVIIGGPTGDYKVLADVTSARWVEYSIQTLSNGSSGVAGIVVATNHKPTAMDYTGATTLNDDSKQYGEAYSLAAGVTMNPNRIWKRVLSSEKRVYIRLDVAGGGACFITLQFRARILERIPGPSVTVHPDHAQQLNIQRAKTIKDRMSAMGIPDYAEEANKGAKD